ncbi:DUF2824 family protein [Salmonella enterica subsp. enterica serovar Newport]|nr:DUF2824 family protein [Salmonella enterica subsp. enterica serovar Newport]
MANQLAKDLEIMFENYVEGFEAACVVSRNAKKFRPGDTAMQRAGDVLYRPQHYHMNIEEGLDLSSKTPTALVQRLVPSVFKEPKNILYTLDAREMRDPEHKTEAGRAAGMRLAAQIDSDLISMVTQRATNVITMADSTTGTQGRDLWNCAAGIDATMTAIGVPQGINRRSFWNPFNYKDLAGELGHRAYAQGATLTAYEKAQIPPVASFDSYKTDISGRVPKGTAASITLAAAPAHKVEAKDANDMPVDNRQGTITVSAEGLQVGDAFTIAGVNSVHQITKDTTGQPQVFRVLAVSGTTVTISPKILPPDNADDGYDYKPECRYFEVNVHGQFGGIVYYNEIQPMTFDCHAMYLPEIRGFSKEIGLAFWRYILTNTTVHCVTSFAARKFRHGQMYCAMIGLKRVGTIKKYFKGVDDVTFYAATREELTELLNNGR